MNYYITNVMEEYTPEFDQMLFYLPLAGSTFKKVYFDEALGRPTCKFVPAENLVVPYDSNDLETCPNITHIVRTSLNDLRKQQVSGFYLDVPVLPSQPDVTDLSDEIDYIYGSKDTQSFNHIRISNNRVDGDGQVIVELISEIIDVVIIRIRDGPDGNPILIIMIFQVRLLAFQSIWNIIGDTAETGTPSGNDHLVAK